MLEIRNLRLYFDERVAIDDLSLTLGMDEILTLVGPTGCGKTSMLRLVAGLETLSAGEIRIGTLCIDRDHPVPPERRRTGLVFQDFALFPHLSVERNIGFRLRDRSAVDHWLRLLGLEDKRRAMPATLSGGQKQRVALARCLAHTPALVLLDEPLSNLDAALKDSLRWEIRDALKTAGVPALWVTHDQAEALSVGDRVGIMRDGRLEQIGEPDACFTQPASRFVARFLGEAVFLPGRINGSVVHTALGNQRVMFGAADAGEFGGEVRTDVEILLRPDDIALCAAPDGNGVIEWMRYEGETRLYGVRLGGGDLLKVRLNHELQLERGASVQAWIGAGQPLAVFPARGADSDRPLAEAVPPARPRRSLPGKGFRGKV
jgi:iron(III) transport system ATP-binding protein